MKIKLKDACVVIEVFEDSRYIDFVSNNLKKLYDYVWHNDKLIVPYDKNQKFKRELVLRNIYYLCVNIVQYENPKFLENLMKSSFKQIELIIKPRNINYKKEDFRKYYILLNSNKSDSLTAIKKKYLKLVKIYHPDRVAMRDEKLIKQYTYKFQQIQEAYDFVRYKKAS